MLPGNVFDGGGTIRQYFDNPIVIQLKEKEGGLKISLRPNDRLRKMFAKIQKYAKDLANIYTSEEKQLPIDFYSLADKFREIDTRDRQIRIKLQSLFYALQNLVDEPAWDKSLSREVNNQRQYDAHLAKVTGDTPEKKKEKLPFEKYMFLAEVRNLVFHDAFNLDQRMIEDVYRILMNCFNISSPC